MIYVFEFLSETHRSNPYVGELSEFSFERDFPRVTEEGCCLDELLHLLYDEDTILRDPVLGEAFPLSALADYVFLVLSNAISCVGAFVRGMQPQYYVFFGNAHF